MNVEIEFENYNIKSPKMPDPFNVNLINAVGSGGGGGNEVELTLAEYEALSEAEKMNGTNYFITDINTTKSLTSKVLCDISVTSTGSNTLNDSIYNYDFIVAELYSPNVTYIEDIFSKAMVTPNNAGRFRLNRLWNTNSYGVVELGLSGTTCNIIDISQTGTFITGTCHLRITGYIYQRVVVPNQMINYSTVETKIGTWIDGKPLYQKVFTFNSSDLQADNNWKKVVFNIPNIDSVKTHKVLVENSVMPLPYSEPNFYFGYFLAYNSSNAVDCRFRYSSDVASNLSIYFDNSIAILQYTKTTD